MHYELLSENEASLPLHPPLLFHSFQNPIMQFFFLHVLIQIFSNIVFPTLVSTFLSPVLSLSLKRFSLVS